MSGVVSGCISQWCASDAVMVLDIKLWLVANYVGVSLPHETELLSQ